MVEALQERVLPAVGAVFVNPAHQLVILGTAGNDQATVTAANGIVDVSNNGRHFRFASRDITAIVFYGLQGDDRFVDATAIRAVANGGVGNDVLSGGGANDLLIGGFGHDRLLGNGGADVLRGQDGNDAAFGGLGNDLLVGGLGNDRLGGNQGHDRLEGQSGNDDLLGDDGNDLLLAGAGADLVHGGRGADNLQGHDGNDDLFGDEGDDRLTGDNGDDEVHGGTGADLLGGGSGDDDIDGDLGDDSIDGGAGHDIARALDGDDSANCEVTRQNDPNELKAKLAGATSAVGVAKFETELEHGIARDELEVQVTGAPINQLLNVFVAGNLVGQIATNGLGYGELQLKSASFAVTAGTVLQIKDASGAVLVEGAFAVESDTDVGEVALIADLIGSTSATGRAYFDIEIEAGVTTTKFEVHTTAAPINQPLDVRVDGTVVGQLDNDDSGARELKLLDPTFQVHEGSLIEVVNSLGEVILSGTLRVL